jgi:hypothetical protein
MLLFSPLWLFVIPGLIVSLLSFIIYIALFINPVRIGNISFDVHTLFFAGAGLVLGYLSISLGVVTRMIGIRQGLLQDGLIFKKIHLSPVLELGGAAGVLLILGGLGSGGYSLWEWGSVGFGALQPGELLRQVSLSTVLVLIGGATLMVSLIMGFLALPTRSERG